MSLIFQTGKRHVRLYTSSVVEGTTFEPIKIPESKGKFCCYCELTVKKIKILKTIMYSYY